MHSGKVDRLKIETKDVASAAEFRFLVFLNATCQTNVEALRKVRAIFDKLVVTVGQLEDEPAKFSVLNPATGNSRTRSYIVQEAGTIKSKQSVELETEIRLEVDDDVDFWQRAELLALLIDVLENFVLSMNSDKACLCSFSRFAQHQPDSPDDKEGESSGNRD